MFSQKVSLVIYMRWEKFMTLLIQMKIEYDIEYNDFIYKTRPMTIQEIAKTQNEY